MFTLVIGFIRKHSTDNIVRISIFT